MKITRTGDFFYTKTEGKVHPKGTLMWMYAVDGSKEELEAYEEAKGVNFSQFDENHAFAGKPIFNSSNRLAEVGQSVNVKMTVEGYLNPIKTVGEVEAEQDLKLAAKQADAQMLKKAKLAKELGLTVQL